MRVSERERCERELMKEHSSFSSVYLSLARNAFFFPRQTNVVYNRQLFSVHVQFWKYFNRCFVRLIEDLWLQFSFFYP